jgi:hypothetical protein
MADQQDFAATLEMDRGLAMHLGHQRAGRVQRKEIALARASAGTDFRHAVGRKHHRRIGIVGDLVQFLDENRALGLQAFDHIAVVHDFVTDIDRGAVERRARSTVSMARTTPAQKPRGEQSTIRRSGLAWLLRTSGASGTESPLAGGRGTVNSGRTWGCFPRSVKAI